MIVIRQLIKVNKIGIHKMQLAYGIYNAEEDIQLHLSFFSIGSFLTPLLPPPIKAVSSGMRLQTCVLKRLRVSLDNHEKWMSVWRGYLSVGKAEGEKSVEGGEEETIKRAIGWRRRAVTNYGRLRGGKGMVARWWERQAGRIDGNAV